MITLLNNRVKRGELDHTSIIADGFANKAKYGTGYGYGYGYGNAPLFRWISCRRKNQKHL
jgi:hypothetical protein